MIWNSFTFAGIASDTYGVQISGDGVYNAPIRSYEMIPIPGRSGDLSIDQQRFENVELTYPAFIVEEFRGSIRDFRNKLLSNVGYQRLTDTYHPDEYRMAIYAGGLEAAPVQGGIAGSFDITFNCKPQRYLVSGETEVSFTVNESLMDESSVDITDENNNVLIVDVPAAKSIYNPTDCIAKPLLQITGVGTVSIGGTTVTITGQSTQVIYMDCDLMESYELSGGAIIPANSKVTLNGGKYPTLGPGNNGVSFTTSDLSIVPRWWRL